MNKSIIIDYAALLMQMEASLNQLAMLWRGCHDQAKANELVRQYQAILNCMIDLGFDTALDIEAELPDHLMPSTYRAMFET